jgi:uncharacterized membrane protein
MKFLTRVFLQGLAAILPIALTIYLLYWVGSTAESLLGGVLQQLLPQAAYRPGMGVVVGALLVLLLGLLLNALVIRRLWRLIVELPMQRIPLVKGIYGAIQDFMGFISGNGQQDLQQVVMVPLGDTGYRIVGFVTRSDCSDLPAGMGGEDIIAVYTPFSYQIGGYTLLLPRSAVEPVDMTIEQGMRFALTAGITTRAAAPKQDA